MARGKQKQKVKTAQGKTKRFSTSIKLLLKIVTLLTLHSIGAKIPITSEIK